MQNATLSVSPITPVNKDASSANKQAEQKVSVPFEQVLSKQVNKDNAKSASEEKQLAEEPLDNASTSVAAKATQDLKAEKQAAVDASVDAQLLAREVTAKTLKEATEGDVVIDEPQNADRLNVSGNASDISEANAPAIKELVERDAETEMALAAQLAPNLQVTAQNSGKPVGNLAATDSLKDFKRTMVDASSDELRDEKVELSSDRLQAKPLRENGEMQNVKFAATLAADSKQQAAAEAFAEKNMKAPLDMAAISTQAAVANKTAVVADPAQLQAAGASNVINASPGKTGWNEAISQKVMWMVGATEQSAKLTLNPKDLGPLQVIINVNNEKADATFISENPEVRKALEEGMSSLRNSMGQAGVELGQANVNTGKQQQAFEQANKEQSLGRSTSQDDGAATDSNLINAAIPTRVSNGLVDTFA